MNNTKDGDLVEVETGVLDHVSDILSERGSNYGTFKDVAETYVMLQDAIRHTGRHSDPMPMSQRSALDMICMKIARIVNGDPGYIDNWDDIQGYAKLVSDQLRGVCQ